MRLGDPTRNGEPEPGAGVLLIQPDERWKMRSDASAGTPGPSSTTAHVIRTGLQLEAIMSWLTYALISAVAAALTAILAKIGVDGVPSTLATAIRTAVVMAFAWSLVFVLGQQQALGTISRRSMIFLAVSGLATGVSWLAYFRALHLAPAAWVAPIDKLSLPLTILLAAVWLREPVTWQVAVGVALMVAGALLTRA